jgi:hypothetical protein
MLEFTFTIFFRQHVVWGSFVNMLFGVAVHVYTIEIVRDERLSLPSIWKKLL